MSKTVKLVLDAFDALPEVEKHQAAMEILRRLSPATKGDISEAAEKLFLALDAEEAQLR